MLGKNEKSICEPSKKDKYVVNQMPLMDTRKNIRKDLQPNEFFGFDVFEDGDKAYQHFSSDESDTEEADGEQDFTQAPPQQHRQQNQSSFCEDPNDSNMDTSSPAPKKTKPVG